MPDAKRYRLKEGYVLGGRYRIGDVLGEGGFGITYEAFDEKLAQPVAIKEFYPRGYASRDTDASARVAIAGPSAADACAFWKEKFLEEARTLAECRGIPGIVSMWDMFEENDTAYIVMELLHGETLKALVTARGVMDGRELAKLAEPLLASLEELHGRGLLHRDISPHNVALARDGTLRLFDFGAARAYDADGDLSMSVVLKHGYAPPEQYRRHGDQGPWTDIYAFCATLYYCLTGSAPESAVDRMCDGGRIVRPNDAGRTVPVDKELEDIVLRGLEIRPEDRYRSARQMREAVSRYLAHAEEAEDRRDRTVTIVSTEGRGTKNIAPDAPTVAEAPHGADEAPADPEKESGDGREKAKKTAGRAAARATEREEAGREKAKKEETKRGSGNAGKEKTKKRRPVLTALLIALAALIAVTAAVQIRREILIRTGGGSGDSIASIRAAQPGSTVRYGRYPQKADGSRALIEWTVLENSGSSVTLISACALELKAYNDRDVTNAWETCSLREWLNGEFYGKAFADAEKAAIRTTSLGGTGGAGDRVFVLSADEARAYFASDGARTCRPTEYAASKGPDLFPDGSCEWWLRSPGNAGDRAARVRGGSVDENGGSVRDGACGVRPVIVLDVGR